MPRQPNRSSQRPGPSEGELSLQWEIKRLRAEVAALRKQGDPDENGYRLGDRLQGVARGNFLIKIERMWRNIVGSLVLEEARCDHCGGVSFGASEAAFAEEAKRLGDTIVYPENGRLSLERLRAP